MKKIKVFAAAFVMTMVMSVTAFAGQWQKDDTGWQYQNSDGTCLKSGWYWVNGASYLFNDKGYVYLNTRTPDGYTVNGDGAWCVNGVVQTRPVEIDAAGLTVRIPNGYDYEADGPMVAVGLKDGEAGALVVNIKQDGAGELKTLFGEDVLNMVSDQMAEELLKEFGKDYSLQAQDTKTFPTGTWNHYQLDMDTGDGGAAQCHLYISFEGNGLRVAVILGKNREFDENQFMTSYIK